MKHLNAYRIILAIILLFLFPFRNIVAQYAVSDPDILPYGNTFQFWEEDQNTVKTYHVDQKNPSSSDENPGTVELPFKTISRAAELLEAGEKVIIHEGIYRESIHPVNSGSGPTGMIIYEAAPGEEVEVRGSFVMKPEKWGPGTGWIYKRHVAYTNRDINTDFDVWMFKFDGEEFKGYNPFGMMNILHDREYLQYQKVKMDAHFRKRGMIFIDGKPLTQVLRPIDLQNHPEGAFWPEHNGMTVHVRFPEGKNPDNCLAEATNREQLFVPEKYGTSYIKVKSIHFSQTGNGFPVPQRGMISSNRGNHWIIENCTIEWANSLGIDLGNEMWHTVDQPGLGYHIVRGNVIRNCGISGLEALRAPGLLVEDNLFENIGWQDAELAFESGAIKFHRAQDCLIRRNVFRNIQYAPGIWLDYLSNKNCRITGNLFSDITTARGAIYIEVSRNLCRVDHNIFHKLRSQYWISGDYGAGGSALYTDGSDSIVFENNLAIDIENSGYGSYLNAPRIVGMRGGITRYHKVLNNVFIDCKKHMIEFPNEDNFSDGNVFCNPKPGYMKIKENGEDLLLDLQAWNQLFGWEENGIVTRARAELNTSEMTLDLQFFDPQSVEDLSAGPFEELKDLKDLEIDPRKILK
jgi:hypothetical protein